MQGRFLIVFRIYLSSLHSEALQANQAKDLLELTYVGWMINWYWQFYVAKVT